MSLLIYSKYLYIIDVIDISDTYMSNTANFKQILIDLDNYNALKELGEAGDSFNDVIRDLLIRTKNYVQDFTRDVKKRVDRNGT